MREVIHGRLILGLLLGVVVWTVHQGRHQVVRLTPRGERNAILFISGFQIFGIRRWVMRTIVGDSRFHGTARVAVECHRLKSHGRKVGEEGRGSNSGFDVGLIPSMFLQDANFSLFLRNFLSLTHFDLSKNILSVLHKFEIFI